ncbi:MAG: aspartate-semialdehyde dehydrogenase [Candidatus Eremiobacteraeota bacterium]|nr:aspartate-semialdehyde dehydrogenase [Candidatus Eremiobacteraeota bacterium]
MNVAVVGATGIVGETILRVMEERGTPVEHLGLFASRAHNAAAEFRGATHDVMATTGTALREYDAVFFAGGEEASERYAPELVRSGRIVIDNSSTFRMSPGIPLIVPEVNPHALRKEHRLLPVGNCTAIILCVALAPIRDCAGLANVRVATYQAVSGAGRAILEEFESGSGPIVRNVIPRIGDLDEFGSSGEESKVRDETRKILELPKLPIAITAVRVPVRCAHSEAVFVETVRDTSVEELARAFENARGIVYHADGIITPREVEGTDLVHVARLRSEDGSRRYFQLWVVGDQLRKGAATNGIQILELLLSRAGRQ